MAPHMYTETRNLSQRKLNGTWWKSNFRIEFGKKKTSNKFLMVCGWLFLNIQHIWIFYWYLKRWLAHIFKKSVRWQNIVKSINIDNNIVNVHGDLSKKQSQTQRCKLSIFIQIMSAKKITGAKTCVQYGNYNGV